MKKYCIVLLTCAIATLTGYMQESENKSEITKIGNVYLPVSMQKLEEFTSVSTPENTEFAWDIHNVLVAKSVWGMLKTGPRYTWPLVKTISSLIKESILYPFTGKSGETHKLIGNIAQLLKERATGEAYKIALNQYNIQLGNMVTDLVNEQYPICGMQQILEEVKQANYTQRVASNIGSHFYPLLIKKYPKFFAYFKGGSTVKYDHQNTIKKPDLRYFELHKQKYQKEPIKYFIFIDEQEKNVLAAARSGMLAILAHTSFVEKLRNDLKIIGVLK